MPFLQFREDFCGLLLSRFPPLKRKADDILAVAWVGSFAGRKTVGEDWVRGQGFSWCYFLQLHMDP